LADSSVTEMRGLDFHSSFGDRWRSLIKVKEKQKNAL
jgi:hypothetical protein